MVTYSSFLLQLLCLSVFNRFCGCQRLADKIVKGEEGALDKYLTYLKAGRSDYPIEIMKKRGVDMTQATYLEEAMKVFEARLNEFETLVDQL